jgi:hypothetical protein
MTTISNTTYYGSTNKDILKQQWVSDPILAQTISAQTVSAQMRAREDDSENSLFLAVGIRVVSNDGSTVRGTVLAVTRGGTQLAVHASTLTNRQVSATSTSVTAQDGDRIVIEIGAGGDPTVSTTHNFALRIGDNAASDLATGNSGTTDNNPWVEFANTITFDPGSQVITPGVLALTTTGLAPTVTVGASDVTVTPGVLALATAGLAPTATVTDNKLATPGVASLATTGLAPTITASDHKTATPAALALATTAYAPVPAATANVTATPDPQYFG